jgi:hypothetical protein
MTLENLLETGFDVCFASKIIAALFGRTAELLGRSLIKKYLFCRNIGLNFFGHEVTFTMDYITTKLFCVNNQF